MVHYRSTPNRAKATTTGGTHELRCFPKVPHPHRLHSILEPRTLSFAHAVAPNSPRALLCIAPTRPPCIPLRLFPPAHDRLTVDAGDAPNVSAIGIQSSAIPLAQLPRQRPRETWKGRGNCRRVQPRVSSRPRKRAERPRLPTIALLPLPAPSTARLLPTTTRIFTILRCRLCPPPSSLGNLSPPWRVRNPTISQPRTSNPYRRGIVYSCLTSHVLHWPCRPLLT